MNTKTRSKSPSKPLSAKYVISKAGGTAVVRKSLGVSRQSLHNWDVVPINRCVAMEELSGIPREDQRPDVFRA